MKNNIFVCDIYKYYFKKKNYLYNFHIKFISALNRANKKLAYCVGTPGFIAPEMLRGLPYDCKADIFSLGATLYVMMAYNPCFYSKNRDEI